MIKLPRPLLSAIPPFTEVRGQGCDVAWSTLLKKVEDEKSEMGLDLMPDFQRGHVWTLEQQQAFVEYALRGGAVPTLYFNCPGYMTARGVEGPYVIVDGLQRLTAVCRFLRGEIRAFGYLLTEFEDKLRWGRGPYFRWHVNTLATRAEVLAWYLEMNAGGTPHPQSELARVRQLLANERREW